MIRKGDFDIDLGDVERSAKNRRHGQARVLRPGEVYRLFSEGLGDDRHRLLFGICYFTGCRISEALQLTADDVQDGLITFRKATTKGKHQTRQVAIVPALQKLFDKVELNSGYIFPGRHGKGHLSRQGADLILREACEVIGLVGVSTHSFRRSYITQLRDKGYSPAQIQRRTGHKRAENLMHYFDQL